MTAAVLYGREDLKIERVSIPVLGDDEMLVRVRVALTCGTDLKVFKRGYHAKMIVPPALFGHELAGVISETRAPKSKVRNWDWQLGDRVVAANSAPCGACFFCQRLPASLSVQQPSGTWTNGAIQLAQDGLFDGF